MDRDLVESAAKGDRAAHVDLIGSRADRLFAIAHRILRDVDRAEDALQDALVIAWRDLRGLRDPGRFDAWPRRLVVNVCIAQATRERRRVVNLRVLPADGPAAPDALHHFVGYSSAEIAATLGIAGSVHAADHEAFLAKAMPIVESFQFDLGQ